MAASAWTVRVEPGLLLFAFSAGAVTFLAPCSIAMLPAYVGFAVQAPGGADLPAAPRSPSRRFAGRSLAMLGLAPLAVATPRLMFTGLSAFQTVPFQLVRRLPSLDASLALLLLGTALVVAGAIVAGHARPALRGVAFGALATLGFLVTFLGIGLPIALLARGLAPYVTWLAVLVGVTLVLAGSLMVAGRAFSVRLPSFASVPQGPKGFFLFGVGYGVSSISCTFPVFLAVIAAGTLAGGVASALAVFAAFALGKATVLVAVTALTVVGGTALGERVKRLAPAVHRASAAILVVAGAYIVWYFGRYAPGIG